MLITNLKQLNELKQLIATLENEELLLIINEDSITLYPTSAGGLPSFFRNN